MSVKYYTTLADALRRSYCRTKRLFGSSVANVNNGRFKTIGGHNNNTPEMLNDGISQCTVDRGTLYRVYYITLV